MSDCGAWRSLAIGGVPPEYWDGKNPALYVMGRIHRPLGPGSGLEQERHRAIVGQADHHMGTEAPGFHPRRMDPPAFTDQIVEDPFSFGRRHRGAEARTQPGAGVGGQRELAHQQQTASGVGQRQVHPPLPVGEDPVADQAPGHLLHLGRSVARLDPHQGEQSGTDGAHGFAVDGDRSGAGALDEDEHGCIVGWPHGADDMNGEWQSLPRRALRLFLLRGALLAIPFGFAALVLAAVADAPAPAWLGVAGAVAGSAFGCWRGERAWRYTAWRLDAAGFALRRGHLWRNETRVPQSRVQHLDLQRGPLQRR